ERLLRFEGNGGTGLHGMLRKLILSHLGGKGGRQHVCRLSKMLGPPQIMIGIIDRMKGGCRIPPTLDRFAPDPRGARKGRGIAAKFYILHRYAGSHDVGRAIGVRASGPLTEES